MKASTKAIAIRDAIRSKRDTFSSCLTKKSYNSAKGARMAVENFPEKAGTGWYCCENCGSWHTTRSYEGGPKK